MSKENNLKKILDERGIKHTWLADKTGVSKSAISEIAQKKRTPTLDTARKIARALGMPLEEIWPEE